MRLALLDTAHPGEFDLLHPLGVQSLETILRDLGRLRVGIFFDDVHQPALLITGQRLKGYALVGLNSRFAFIGRQNIVWRSWAHDGLRPLGLVQG